MTDIFERLAAPFPPHLVSWRIGSKTKDGSKGMALAYIDARDVMERLDTVMGPGGWQCRYPHANGKTVCEIGIYCGGEWVWKADGAGDTDFEAEKGALSDAFKRAAVRWGIGRYLYHIDAPWVALEGEGKFAKIKQSEYARLERLLPGAKVGASAATEEIDESVRVYIDLAREAIKIASSRPELKLWWETERAKRKKLGLTEMQERDLYDEMTEKWHSLPKVAA